MNVVRPDLHTLLKSPMQVVFVFGFFCSCILINPGEKKTHEKTQGLTILASPVCIGAITAVSLACNDYNLLVILCAMIEVMDSICTVWEGMSCHASKHSEMHSTTIKPYNFPLVLGAENDALL